MRMRQRAVWAAAEDAGAGQPVAVGLHSGRSAVD